MSRPRPRTAVLTDLLMAWSDGDDKALEELTPMVYQELHRLAHHYLLGERHRGLQTTELVNEAFLRLVDNHIPWSGRTHFYVVAARTMRRVLVDLARRRRADKRDGMDRQVPLLDGDQVNIDLADQNDTTRVDLLALDRALEQLAQADERKSQAVELRYFGGLAVAEIARVLNVSLPTAERDLRLARAWLGQAIQGAGPS